MVSNLTGKINLNTRISTSNNDNSQKAKIIQFTPSVAKKTDDSHSKSVYEIKTMKGVTNLKGPSSSIKHNYTIAVPKKGQVKENMLMKSINVQSKEFDREEILAKHSLIKEIDCVNLNSKTIDHDTNHGKFIIKI